MGKITPRQEFQSDIAGMTKDYGMSKEWAKEEKTHNQARANPWKEQANKEWKIRKQFTPQEVKDER